MATATRTKVDTALRDEWLRTVDALANQIAEWVRQEPGWSFEETGTQEIEEPPLGQYTATLWSIHTASGEVRLEPIGRNYPGRGIIELFAWPTLYRVRLTQDDFWGGWRIRTDSGISLRQEWNRANFVILVRDLIDAGA